MKTKKSKIVKLIERIKRHKTSFLSTFIFVAVIAFFIIFAYARIQAINAAASDKLDMATKIIASGNIEQGLSIMDDLMNNYKRTPSAYRAMLMKSNYLINQKNYEQAEQLLNNFIENAVPEIVKPIGYPLLISVYDDNGNIEQAITLSKEFLSKYENNYLAPSVAENLARLYELSDKAEEANQIYKDIVAKYVGTVYANKANDKLKEKE